MSSRILKMYFLEFQDIHMDAVDDSEVETHDIITDVCTSNAT